MMDLEKTLKHVQIETPFVVCTNFSREHGFPVFALIYHVDKKHEDFHLLFSRGYRNCPREFEQNTVVCAGYKGSLYVARGNKVKSELSHDWLVRLKENVWVPFRYLFQLRVTNDLVGLFKNQYTVQRTIKPPTDIVPIHAPLRWYKVMEPKVALVPQKNAVHFQTPCTIMANMISGGETYYATLVAVHPVSKQCLILPWGEENSDCPVYGNPAILLKRFLDPAARWYVRACPSIWIPLDEAVKVHTFHNPPHVELIFSLAVRGRIKDKTPSPLIPYSQILPNMMEEEYLKNHERLGETWGQRVAHRRANPFYEVDRIPASWVIHDNSTPTIPKKHAPNPSVTLPRASMLYHMVEPYFQLNQKELVSWESQVRDAVTPSPGYRFMNHSLAIHDHHITKEKTVVMTEPSVPAKDPKMAHFWISEMSQFDCFGQPPVLIQPSFVEAAQEFSRQHQKEIKPLTEPSDDIVAPPPKKKKRVLRRNASSYIGMEEGYECGAQVSAFTQELLSAEEEENVRLATIALYRQAGQPIPEELFVDKPKNKKRF